MSSIQTQYGLPTLYTISLVRYFGATKLLINKVQGHSFQGLTLRTFPHRPFALVSISIIIRKKKYQSDHDNVFQYQRYIECLLDWFWTSVVGNFPPHLRNYELNTASLERSLFFHRKNGELAPQIIDSETNSMQRYAHASNYAISRWFKNISLSTHTIILSDKTCRIDKLVKWWFTTCFSMWIFQ